MKTALKILALSSSVFYSNLHAIEKDYSNGIIPFEFSEGSVDLTMNHNYYQ